ncbi:flagellar basal body-associated FliL family protein [Chelativorans sp. YIM 93263]|uniref:flagellar basal body-associated FliL family protein n=1 Tax=Chelativorans sp. YIM 93263 TaxID=2906648 RepID=UPI002378000B|nr:flagellar basal body-associated FliL family protein [Chelativorans sp. YIM 93263]
MALVAGEEAKKKGPSPLVQLLALLVVTAIAAGIGWYAGGYLQANRTPASDAAEAEGNDGQATGQTEIATADSPRVVALEPIMTSLADPHDVWVRLELALVFNEDSSSSPAHEIHQDLFAYVRTLKLRQIDTPSGFQNLKADLLERAKIRSGGQVSDVLITTFLYE